MKIHRAALRTIALMVLVAALPAMADEKAVTLARTFKKGEVSRLKMESVVTVMGGEFQVVQTLKMTVQDVKDNGHVVIEQAGEGGKLTGGGVDMDIPGSPPVTVTYDKFGKLVEMSRNAATDDFASPEVSRLLATVTEPIVNGKEVKSGDSWETEFDNPVVKGKKVKVKTTYAGTDKLDGVEVWKLKQTAEADTDDKSAKTSYEATEWLDPANGHSVKSESLIKDLPTNHGVLTFKNVVTRIKDDKK